MSYFVNPIRLITGHKQQQNTYTQLIVLDLMLLPVQCVLAYVPAVALQNFDASAVAAAVSSNNTLVAVSQFAIWLLCDLHLTYYNDVGINISSMRCRCSYHHHHHHQRSQRNRCLIAFW
ncbi:PREDICTED: uncharacterized protein LOC108363256 [Rhagoletis zephyria]|uniref:uncharacterized protein LOC108363256 n=1 Tax=Rhagoletis zephyria TaxID=28612 RepID=UPI000811981A|nr:PREDICTED: uncharacterized protein LOC108363256 [Rhagoletis zephyria]